MSNYLPILRSAKEKPFILLCASPEEARLRQAQFLRFRRKYRRVTSQTDLDNLIVSVDGAGEMRIQTQEQYRNDHDNL